MDYGIKHGEKNVRSDVENIHSMTLDYVVVWVTLCRLSQTHPTLLKLSPIFIK